ncbi:unnamed protein product [Auanema sp. JU1783]|nr:unnamed protein product [Auanema sp. JU1783]
MAEASNEIQKKSSLEHHSSSKKSSNCSSDGSIPRKKSSIKENIVNVFRSPHFLARREAARIRWNKMAERLKLNRIKVAVTESKLFSPGERRRRSAENGHNNSSAPMSGSQNEWQLAFDNVIYDEAGREAFAKFLSTEYSDENIDFWWAAEQLKVLHRNGERQKFEETVLSMFDSFIATEGGYSINIDHDTREDIFAKVVNMDPSTFPPNIFDKAQAHVYRLMEKDCFSRFVHTDGYKQVAKKLSLPQNFGSNGRTTSPH